MRKLITSILLLALPLLASAYDCQVDGIYYNLNTDGNVAEVTYESTSYNSYSGEIIIPEKITYKGVDYFVTSIGQYAFQGSNKLSSVSIANSITTIGERAFSVCKNLTSISIPKSVNAIGGNAFYNCNGLNSVQISDIAAWCCIDFVDVNANPLFFAHYLYDVEGRTIKNLIIPEGVESINNYAFYGCSSLTSVTIPNSVTIIGDRAFYNCSGLTSVIMGNSVTTIGNYAFNNCSGLTSVTIPNSVTSIGDYAFSGCYGLISVDIPNSVTSIGSSAFRGCSGLTSVTIPNSVASIGSSAFRGCSGLTSMTIPNSVTSIGSDAFSNCSGLTSVTIGSSVTSIGYYAFSYCSGLTSLTIPNSVATIGGGAFLGCSGLTSLTIPNSLTSIEDETFTGCSGLTSLTIPNSVTSIGRSAFSGCSGLTSVTIGNSVTYIGYYAFSGCSGLTSVNISDLKAWCTIGYEQSGPSDIGSNPLLYAHHLFLNGEEINDLVIPNSLTYIGSFAFAGCSGLSSVTIPSTIKAIGWGAFYGCSGLTSVTCYADNVPDTNYNNYEYIDIFTSSTYQNAVLYVPEKSLSMYKSTNIWSFFKYVKVIGDDSEIEIKKCATPSISYADKVLTFDCETEGVEFKYTITDSDIKSDFSNKVSISATYQITVLAMKTGYENSDIATATLVWTEAIFTETTETPTSAKAVTESIPVLISANGGVITVKSEVDGQKVEVYSVNGQPLGASTIQNGQATIATPMQRGEIVIVKVGGRSVKIKN